MVGCVRAWRQRREAGRHLAVMSERELQDIGIGRSEMIHEIGKSSWPWRLNKKDLKGRSI
jgi:uncharacterized protein YjiS (DUF1127 family)